MKGGTSCDTALAKPDHRVGADLHELVDAGEAADDDPVADLARGRASVRVVGDVRVVADHAVVRDVHVGHDPVVVAHARHALVLHRADVEACRTRGSCCGRRSPARWARPAYFLSCGTRRARRTGRCGCRGRWWCGLRSRSAGRPWCPAPIFTCGPITVYGPTSTELSQLGAPVDDRGRVDAAPCGCRRQAIVRIVHISSASQAMSSPTRAAPLNLQMPALRAHQRHVHDQLVARLHRPLEARAVDAGEVDTPSCRRARCRGWRTTAARRPAPSPRASARPASPAGAGSGPTKNGSLIVTFLSALMRLPFSTSSTRSTSRNG